MSQAEDGPPPGALTWSTSVERTKALRAWREGCIRALDREARQVRLAWRLEGLFSLKGYAFPTNETLSRMTGVASNKVQDAMLDLERAGAIVRQRVEVGKGKVERRIFPGAKIAEQHFRHTPSRGGGGLPRDRYPVTGVQRIEEKARGRGDPLSREQRRARADAERRDAKARGEKVAGWLDDDLPS